MQSRRACEDAAKGDCMNDVITEEIFHDSIIAQDDCVDYSEQGWVAVIIAGVAYLTDYSHCSCYGTWTSIGAGDYSSEEVNSLPSNWYKWSGTVDELIDMAKRNADPAIPERSIQDDDSKCYCGKDHLKEVYKQIITSKLEGGIK